MRLGKVKIDGEFIVDLDNQQMVLAAKNLLYEELLYAEKYDQLFDMIKATDEDKTLKEKDISEILIEKIYEDNK